MPMDTNEGYSAFTETFSTVFLSSSKQLLDSGLQREDQRVTNAVPQKQKRCIVYSTSLPTSPKELVYQDKLENTKGRHHFILSSLNISFS